MSDDGETVTLKKRSGKTVEVLIEALCEADRNYISAERENNG